MEARQVPQDDITDVMEMTKKIEESINDTLRDNDFNLSISALMSASVNSMLSQCNNLEEILFYRNLFVEVLDNSIRLVKIINSREAPPSPPSSSPSS